MLLNRINKIIKQLKYNLKYEYIIVAMSDELYNEYGDINFENNDEKNGHHSNKHKIYEKLAKTSNYLPLILRIPINNSYKTRSVKIGCYMAGPPGSTIINAVTGQKYPGHIVGKFDEDLYYKVMLCNGVNGPNPVTLFYDSPSQYEKHFCREISQKTKEDWFEKYEYQQGIEERKQKDKNKTNSRIN